MKFRKKPVVIEAVLVADIIAWRKRGYPEAEMPAWVLSAFFAPANAPEGQLIDNGPVLLVNTLEGVMQAKPDDWIIRGVKGELYPCKPDIFAATYDSAD